MTPDIWQAVLVESIKGAAAVLVAAVGVGLPAWRRLGRIKRAAEATHREAVETREQVKNDHGTNLRDDIDRALAASEEARESSKEARTLAVSNQSAILALAAEIRHLASDRGWRPWGRRR